jgi:hypothetical protein
MADIGTTLREARMRARIDISEVEARTKIRAKYLRAIENEEWDLLPGPVYVKSFLRTYGDFLGLDSRMLVEEFKRRYERPSDHDTRPIAPLGRDRDRSPRGPVIPPWAVIGLVLVAVLVALYVIGTRTSGTTKTSSTSANLPATHPAKHRHKQRHRAHRVAPAKPKTVTLKLVATGALYVCLEDGNGKRLIPGVVYNPGQTIPTESARKLLLTLGNASVQMKVNGKTIPVPGSAGSIGFLLQPGATRPLPVGLQPTCT